MFDKKNKNENKYVSCIKINGVPILPPVITSSKRKELLKDKEQAIKLEKRLKRERELREYINRHYMPRLEESSGIFSESLEHHLSFDDNPTLNLTIATSHVEVPPSNISKKKPSLRCDLLVSQYTNNQFQVLTDSEILNVHVAEDDNENISNSEKPIEDPPKLIRSESFVLEAPSPLLLQNLQKYSIGGDSVALKTLTNATLYEMSTPKVCAEAERPNFEVCESFGNLSSVSRNDFTSETESELRNLSDETTVIPIQNKSSNNENIVTEQEIAIKETVSNQKDEKKENGNKLDLQLRELSMSECDKEKLHVILKAIPEAYSKQLIELLEKQKQQQLIRLDSYARIKETYLETESTQELPKITIAEGDKNKINTIDNESQYFTPDSLMVSFENKKNVNEENMNEYNKSPMIFTRQCEYITAVRVPKSCNRKLFFTYGKNKIDYQSKQEWAASKIQSHIKGYLTRRLLRTERVQGLIQTIKDALLCAVELHSDISKNFNESDVELHRRLIQQVTAACFAFHDVFFQLSIRERMEIIRHDRERIKEKLQRPKSRTLISSRSFTSSVSSKN